MNTIQHKQGTTFSYSALVQLPTGTWSVASKLRDSKGRAVSGLTPTLTPPVAPETRHLLMLVANATSTAAWPLEVLHGDIKFSDATGVVLATSTYAVQMQELES